MDQKAYNILWTSTLTSVYSSGVIDSAMVMGVLTIKSPCYDASKVEITPPDSTPDYLYWLSSSNPMPQAFFLIEDAVTTDLTTTTPGFVTTCALTRTITFNDTPVTTTSTPLKLLTTDGLTLEIFSQDYSLVNTAPINSYTVKFCFTQNTVVCAENTG